ncbi:MAG TPA: ABC transporter substrate-binding protein [Xanthobacteraceae bacterium]|jgi:NitT/TauT family transport system substrate-binding protein|nr:ABC transporter substrate-binding protein [Xanthobacteraceae bacterium]
MRALRSTLAALVALAVCASAAAADDTLKIAIGQKDNWENQVPALGTRAGIFKKHGIVLEMFGTAGAGETLQAVIGGSADIGIGIGTPGALRAFARGAPIRALAAGFTGTNDLYWYVPTNSPLKSLTDATEKNTIAYSTSGSTSNNLVLAFAKELGVKAKPTATGGPPSTFTQVMSGQIDIGWAAPPFGLDAIEEGKIRIIGRGSDASSTRNQTVRVQIVNLNTLQARKDVLVRFMQAYRETLDWMYADPAAVKYYAESIEKPERLVLLAREKFYPKEAILPDRVSDFDKVMEDSVALKFLDAPLNQKQVSEFFQIPPPAK